MSPSDDLLTENECWPHTLAPDTEPGFALFNYDRYYVGQGRQPTSYRNAPSSSVTAGKTPMKRDIHLVPDGDVEALVFDDGNSTRWLSDEELAQYRNIHRCKDDSCTEEVKMVEEQLAAMQLAYEETVSAYVADIPVQSLSVSSQHSEMILTDSSSDGMVTATSAAAASTQSLTDVSARNTASSPEPTGHDGWREDLKRHKRHRRHGHGHGVVGEGHVAGEGS